MSILPKWYKGRVCIPWWYGLGYACVYITIGLSIGIKIESETMIAITTASAIAMMVASLIGAIAYVVLYATSKYQKQKADAEELKAKIVASGRDPDDLAQLSVAEKWEIIIMGCIRMMRVPTRKKDSVSSSLLFLNLTFS